MYSKKSPFFSIVIPSLNSARYIARTIDSILAQSFQAFEIIVVDSFSADNTIAIVSSFADSRIKFIQRQDSGMYEALNTGFSLAQSPCFTYLNSDDLYSSSHSLEIVYSRLRESIDQPIISYGDTIFVDEQDLIIYALRSTKDSFYAAVHRGRFAFAQPSCFWSSNLHALVGEFSEHYKYAGDYDFFLKCFRLASRRMYIKHSLSKFRLHQASLYHTYTLKANEEVRHIQASYDVKDQSLRFLLELPLKFFNIDNYLIRFARKRFSYP